MHPVQPRKSEALGRLRRDRSETKRSTSGCSEERLENLLRSCRASAAASLAESSSEAPLLFCGADCSHLVFLYASECSMQEFILNISGACKKRGNDFVIDCLYAVVIVKSGITACTKMMLNIDSRHDGLADLFDSSNEYVNEQCCSLETSYSSTVLHDVYVDGNTRRAVTVPPLQAPWQGIDPRNYDPVVEITNGDICLASTRSVTASSTTDILNITTHTTSMASSTTSTTEGTPSVEAVNSASLPQCRCELPSIVLCFVLLYTASLALMH